jgi:SAM-dependent methyltransferase
VTEDYYDRRAKEFYDNSVEADVSELYKGFLDLVPDGGWILDAGCGSGRDSKAFLEMGYQVEAIDASASMADLASKLTGLDVKERRFEEIDTVDRYDGVWACASLLHVPYSELARNLNSLVNAVKDSGVIYASFKLGDGERQIEGRSFTDMNPQRVEQLLLEFPTVRLVDAFITSDVRPGRDEEWINLLLHKGATNEVD